MSKPTDQLFLLIHSLSAAEKSYFKITAKKYAKTEVANYGTLFDCYNNWDLELEPFTEEAFLKKLKAKRLKIYSPDNKRNLYELVLKTMSLYHSDLNVEGTIEQLKKNVRFLMKKSFFDQAEKIYNKAWTLAEERELSLQKLQLIELRYRLDIEAFTEGKARSLQDLKAMEDRELALIKMEREVIYIQQQLYHLYLTNSIPKKQEESERLMGLLTHIQGQPVRTFYLDYYLLIAQSFVLEKQGKVKEALALYEVFITAFEQSIWKMEEQQEKYLKLLKNCCVLYFRVEDFKSIALLLDKIKAIKTADSNTAKNVFVTYHQLFLVLCLNDGDKLKEAFAIIPELKKGLKKYSSSIEYKEKANFYSNICWIYFKSRRFVELFDAIQELYEFLGREKEYQFMLVEIKFMEVIALYEMNTGAALDSYLRNTKNFMEQTENYNDFTKGLLKGLKELLPLQGKERLKGKRTIKEQLSELSCPANLLVFKMLFEEWLDG